MAEALDEAFADEPERLQRLAGRFLLGRLLRRPPAEAGALAGDEHGADETTVVRRPLHLQHLVLDRVAAAGKRLLQLGLVVEVAGVAEIDPLGEASTTAGSTASKPCSR